MPRTSTLGETARVEPDGALREAAWEVARTSAAGAELVMRYPDGREVQVPRPLVDVLRTAADELSAGHAVTILASETLLTPAEAGRLLGLSRPFVVRLLDEGTIPSSHLPDSRHRLIRLDDVLAFAERRRRRQEGRQRLAEAVNEVEKKDQVKKETESGKVGRDHRHLVLDAHQESNGEGKRKSKNCEEDLCGGISKDQSNDPRR